MLKLVACCLVLTCAGCSQSAEDLIDEFVEESGQAFGDCGAGTLCDESGLCLIDAFTECLPARVVVEQDNGSIDTMFVVPEGAACHVIWFKSYDLAGEDRLEKFKCEGLLGAMGGLGCVDPNTCNLRNRWHL